MVKSSSWIKLFLVLVLVMVSVVSMAPTYSPQEDVEDVNNSSKRNARSTNLSPYTGTCRKLRILINNRYLQILHDGTVNGTEDDNSDFIILQRTSVSSGHVRIEGLAACLYLCMDSCGFLYSTSRHNDDDCVFNETFESNKYTSYSSVRYSDARRTLYVAFKRNGKPRNAAVETGAGIGNLASNVDALPDYNIAADRLERLAKYKCDQQHHQRHSSRIESKRCQQQRAKKEAPVAQSTSASAAADEHHSAHSGTGGGGGGGGGGDKSKRRNGKGKKKVKKSRKKKHQTEDSDEAEKDANDHVAED